MGEPVDGTLDVGPLPRYSPLMQELVRTTDPTLIPFVQALLSGEDIDCFVLDANMSVLEGSIGIFPRRIVVHEDDLVAARRVLRDNGVEPYEGEDWL